MAQSAGQKKIIRIKNSTDIRIQQNSNLQADKINEKTNYPKKSMSLKKIVSKTSKIPSTVSYNSVEMIKYIKNITDIFTNLSNDDLEFIKALDIQFKLHGDKVKIKVEHENTTEQSKNSKRTIEHDLGYGYEQNGYTYDKPKFMFYPYSQNDIPPSPPGYYPHYTDTQDVKVVPSHSFELKPEMYVVHKEHSTPQIDIPHPQESRAVYYGPQAHNEEGVQEPVIILRIPGPTKYASHLQGLLQQYLEIRAAQYLRILQEAEFRKHQEFHQKYEGRRSQDHNQQHCKDLRQQPQHLEHQLNSHIQPQPLHDETPQDYMLVSHNSAVEQKQVQPSYPAIDDVYQTFKQRQKYHQQTYMDQQYEKQEQQQHHDQQIPADHSYSLYEGVNGPQQYFYPNEQQQGQAQPYEHYQQTFVYEMTPPVYSNAEDHITKIRHCPQSVIYVKEEDSTNDNGNNDHKQSAHLATSENNPRSTHTKIIFTRDTVTRSADHSSSYPFPPIRQFERNVPTPSELYHQPYHQKNEINSANQKFVVESASSQTVSITSRPFNDHAHPPKSRNNSRRKSAVPTIKPARFKRVTIQTPKHTHQKFEKLDQYMQENIDTSKPGSVTEVKPNKSVKE